jgi:hypothetical protein
MVLYQVTEVFRLWSIWACSLWCQQGSDKADYMGCFTFWSWSWKHQAFASLYSRTQECSRGRLTGMQLMAFFLQRCIQPLQSQVSKLWTYSGSTDPSWVSA